MATPDLNDPDYAAFAWKRFRRMLGWTGVVAAIGSVISVWALGQAYGALGWVAVLATIGGVSGSIVMAGALMGLVFLSSGTGHDAAVDRFRPDA